MENQTKVGIGVIVIKDGKVLLGRRKNSHADGEYASPGGKLEYMESFEDCVKREVLEECGLSVTNIKLLFVSNIKTYAPKHFVNIELSADWVSGEPQTFPDEKIGDWAWYDIDNLPTPIFPPTQQGIQSYKTGKINYYDNTI